MYLSTYDSTITTWDKSKSFNFLLNIFIDAEHFMFRGILFQISIILFLVEYFP